MSEIKKIKNPDLQRFITKPQLAEVMNMNVKTLKRYTELDMDNILKIDPFYNVRRLVSPKVTRYLYECFMGKIPVIQDKD